MSLDIKGKKTLVLIFALYKMPGQVIWVAKETNRWQMSTDTHPWCRLTAWPCLPLWKERLF